MRETFWREDSGREGKRHPTFPPTFRRTLSAVTRRRSRYSFLFVRTSKRLVDNMPPGRILGAAGLAVFLLFLDSARPLESTTTSSSSRSVAEAGARETTRNGTTVPSPRKDDRRESDSVAANLPRAGRITTGRDSYLDALEYSRRNENPGKAMVRKNADRREYAQGPVYAEKEPVGSVSPFPSNGDSVSYVRSESYSIPSRTSGDLSTEYASPSHGVPRITYGPPASSVPPNGRPTRPRPSYGEYSDEAPQYLPPQQAYGSSSSSVGHGYGHGYGPGPGHGHGYGPSYGAAPHGFSEIAHVSDVPTVDFSWPFALKLNAFTLAKILLKLVIFKLIVKFIAVICLLLFVPKLEIKKRGNKGGSGMNGSHDNDDEDDEDEGRRFATGWSMATTRLDALTSAVTRSIETYERLNRSQRSTETFDDSARDYARLFRSYVLEES